jgi:hypothetical protein
VARARPPERNPVKQPRPHIQSARCHGAHPARGASALTTARHAVGERLFEHRFKLFNSDDYRLEFILVRMGDELAKSIFTTRTPPMGLADRTPSRRLFDAPYPGAANVKKSLVISVVFMPRSKGRGGEGSVAQVLRKGSPTRRSRRKTAAFKKLLTFGAGAT